MTTTRCYGNWTNRVSPYNSTLEAEVAQALDTYEPTEAVLDTVCAAYREAINAALPPGVVLAGNEFYGPADAECPPLDVILDGIDFWALAEPILEQPRPRGDYIAAGDCVAQETHLRDTDDDGYCNLCGEQGFDT